jgi:hypothetical protein
MNNNFDSRAAMTDAEKYEDAVVGQRIDRELAAMGLGS